MRYLITFLAVLLVLGVLGGVKAAQIGRLVANGKEAEAAGPPPEFVATAIAKSEAWEKTLVDVGSVASRKGVTVTNELPGTVTRIHFDSGKKVKQGDLLVELDAKVERSQLASALARLDLARTTAARSEALVKSGAISQAQNDADRAALESSEKDVQALEEQIAKKQIRAPFAGRLGIRAVNLGQYLAPATPITILHAEGAVYVDFTVPQVNLPELSVGTPVRISFTTEAGAPRTGAIEAIEPAVDPTTRTAKVRASVPNDDGVLREGMFVEVTVLLPEKRDVVAIPATALVHASFGDSVFVVEDKPEDAPGMRTTPDGRKVRVARQQFVRTGDMRGDFAAILDGVKAGQEVVTAGAFKLQNGSPVVVDNTIQPEPQLAPRPENR